MFVTLQLNSKRSLIPLFNQLCANDLLLLFVVQLLTVVIIVVTSGVLAQRQRSTVPPPQNYSLSDNIFFKPT